MDCHHESTCKPRGKGTSPFSGNTDFTYSLCFPCLSNTWLAFDFRVLLWRHWLSFITLRGFPSLLRAVLFSEQLSGKGFGKSFCTYFGTSASSAPCSLPLFCHLRFMVDFNSEPNERPWKGTTQRSCITEHFSSLVYGTESRHFVLFYSESSLILNDYQALKTTGLLCAL